MLFSIYLYIGNLFSGNETGAMIESIIFGSLIIVGFVALLVFDYVKGISRFNRVAIVMMLTLFIVMIFVIANTPNIYDLTLIGYYKDEISATIEISNEFKVQSIFGYSSLLILVYSSLFLVAPLIKIRSKLIMYTLSSYLIIVFIVCVLTLFIEHDNYVLFIENFKTSPQEFAIKAFFPHRNAWGFFLLITMFMDILLSIVMNKKYIACFSIVFYGFMFFSFCKTTLILGLVMVLAFLVYYLIHSFSSHRKRNLIIVGISGAVILTALVICLTTPLREAIETTIISKGGDSFESRTVIWDKIFQMMDSPSKVIFGIGKGVLDKNLYAINLAEPHFSQNWYAFKAHNMYIQTLGDGGIILFACFVFTICYILKLLIKNYKNDHYVNYALIAGFCTLLTFWIFES